MRTFFGIEIPGDVAMQIADWRDRQLGRAGRPIPPANFHITLAFVGELAPGQLERLGESVERWVESNKPRGQVLQLDSTGYWPKPGIYWLGPRSWPDPLSRLAEKLRHLSSTAGARRDRNKFQPHVTLFRNCNVAPPAPSSIPSLELGYRHFTLFESRAGKNGVSYHPLQEWELLPPVS